MNMFERHGVFLHQEEGAGEVSAGHTIAMPGIGETPTDSTAFLEAVPETFRGKDWVKEAGSMEKVFQSREDLRAKLSQRPSGVPEDTASDEQWAEFGKALGVPEDGKGYKLEGVKEEHQEAIGSALHKAGLSARQVNKLMPEMATIAEAIGDAQVKSDDVLETEFNEMAVQAMGSQEAVDEAVKTAAPYLSKMVPESMQGALKDMPNQQVVMLSAVISKMHKEYVSADTVVDPETVVKDASDHNAEGIALMTEQLKYNETDPMFQILGDKILKHFGNA